MTDTSRLRSTVINGILMALRQITLLVGPLLAGLLIALFGNQATAADTTGIGLDLPNQTSVEQGHQVLLGCGVGTWNKFL